MKSATLLKLSAAMLLGGPLAGCAHISTTADVPHCERLIPPGLVGAVEAVTLPESTYFPDGHEDAEPWREGFVGQTGQLDKANERPAAVDHIYRTCLDMHREALRQATRRRFLGVF